MSAVVSTDASLPGHLGSALPGTVVLDKGLPEVERSSPLAGAAGSGSHLAGDQAGVTLLGSWPSAEEMLVLLREFDQAERDSAFAMYTGRKNPTQHMVYVYQLRNQRADLLDRYGWHTEADMVRERIIRETGEV